MDSIKAFFRDGVYENGYIWVFDNQIQAICKISVTDFELKVIGRYKGKDVFIARRIFLFQDMFYLVERNSTKILIYDRNKQGKDTAFCLQETKVCNRTEKYAAFFYGDRIYLFPRSIDGEVIVFETSTREYIKSRLFEDSIKAKIRKEDLFIKYPSNYQEVLWFVLNNSNFYGRYDLATRKAELFQAGDKGTVLSGCCFDGERIWLTESHSSDVICVGERTVSILDELPWPYSFPYSVDEGIIIPSGDNGDKLVFIEKATFKVSIVELPLSEKTKQLTTACREYIEQGNFIFLFPLEDRSMFVFDKDLLKITQVNLKSDNYIERDFIAGNVVLCEDECINIKHLLQFSGENSASIQSCMKEKIETGQTVWKAMK